MRIPLRRLLKVALTTVLIAAALLLSPFVISFALEAQWWQEHRDNLTVLCPAHFLGLRLDALRAAGRCPGSLEALGSVDPAAIEYVEGIRYHLGRRDPAAVVVLFGKECTIPGALIAFRSPRGPVTVLPGGVVQVEPRLAPPERVRSQWLQVVPAPRQP